MTQRLGWRSLIGSLLCSGALAGLQPAAARACSGLQCGPDQFLPRAGLVPANLPAIAFWPGFDTRSDGDFKRVMTTASDLEFECEAPDGSKRALQFDFDPQAQGASIRPHEPLRAGERCKIRSRAVVCDLVEDSDFFISREHDRTYLSGRADFEVAQVAPLPARLGRLVIEPAAVESLELEENAACSLWKRTCAIRAVLKLDAEAEPWKDALVYETYVDGERWQILLASPIPVEAGAGGAYLGRGRDLFYSEPPDPDVAVYTPPALTPGRHSVVVRAYVPGTDDMLATAATEIDLDCTPDSDAGTTPIDAGTTPKGDAATDPAPDARPAGASGRGSAPSGSVTDARDGGSGAPGQAGAPRTSRSGSGCSAPGVSRDDADAIAPILLVLAGVGLRSRRRERASGARRCG